MNYKKDEATDLLKKLGIELKHEDQDKDGKALLKVNILPHIIVLYNKLMCYFVIQIRITVDIHINPSPLELHLIMMTINYII